MGFGFREVETCAEHGFALNPEGECIRCLGEAAARQRRAQRLKLASGAAVVVALLGVGGALARARSRPVEAPAPRSEEIALAPSAVPAVTERPFVTVPDRTPTSRSARGVLDEWDAELARAEATRAADLAAQAAAERQQRAEALEAPVPERDSTTSPGRRRGEPPPSSVDHPSWWQDQRPIPGRPRGSIAAQQRAMAAAGVAPYDVTNPNAWLPPNNGGNFANHRPSR